MSVASEVFGCMLPGKSRGRGVSNVPRIPYFWNVAKTKKSKTNQKAVETAVQVTNRFTGPAPLVNKSDRVSMAHWVKSCLHIVDPVTKQTTGDMILAAQMENAIQGDVSAAQFLFDRAFGKPVETVMSKFEGDQNINVKVVIPKRKGNGN